MSDLEPGMRDLIEQSVAVQQALLEHVPLYAEVAERIIAAYQGGHKLLVFGNGGSAADAQHIAAEFVGRFAFDRPPVPALALTVNTSVLTALGNDYGFDSVFARQVEALGQPGDVALGMSTSGNSTNVVAGLRRARECGLLTIGMSGEDGGLVAASSQYCVCVPSRITARIQEGHILIAHLWCECVERGLFGAA